MNTNLKIKRKLFPIFMKAIKQELEKGGKKYAQNNNKEWTDTISEFDPDFMSACILKYIGRVKNSDPRAENDLAKIATYAYLIWIKKFGEVHLKPKEDNYDLHIKTYLKATKKKKPKYKWVFDNRYDLDNPWPLGRKKKKKVKLSK